MESIALAVDERRSLLAEYALIVATLLTVLLVAGGAALTAHHFLSPVCATLAQSNAASASVSCR
jgi:Flp pilus assembly pilin Flp